MVTLPSRVECRGNKAFFLVPDCDGCIGIRNEHDSAHIPELVLTALISLLGPQEIVLKKRLFVVTEKKIMREVIVQKPIGMVTSLSKGKVGFFKGSGLFIKFASEAGIPEMKIDTTDQDAKWATNTYKYIISGQADKELAATAPSESEEQKAPQLIICPICSAPYTEKIYRGQTSINCEYCGTAIQL